jgi:hypothetical protein
LDNYTFYSITDHTFSFTPCKEIVYVVEFSNDGSLLENYTGKYAFRNVSFYAKFTAGFKKSDILHKIEKDRIGYTIVKIVEYYINNNTCCLAYVCESDDRSSHARMNLFSNWRKFQSINCYHKQTSFISEDNDVYYGGVISGSLKVQEAIIDDFKNSDYWNK